jgi:ABC-type uncharacterized transport system substrate-binding protein
LRRLSTSNLWRGLLVSIQTKLPKKLFQDHRAPEKTITVTLVLQQNYLTNLTRTNNFTKYQRNLSALHTLYKEHKLTITFRARIWTLSHSHLFSQKLKITSSTWESITFQWDNLKYLETIWSTTRMIKSFCWKK